MKNKKFIYRHFAGFKSKPILIFHRKKRKSERGREEREREKELMESFLGGKEKKEGRFFFFLKGGELGVEFKELKKKGKIKEERVAMVGVVGGGGRRKEKGRKKLRGEIKAPDFKNCIK